MGRRGARRLLFERAVHINLITSLIHQFQVLITHNLALALLYLLLLVLNLHRSEVILLDHLLVTHHVIPPCVRFMLVFLRNQLISCLTKHPLLLPVVIKHELVLHASVGNCPKHIISFTKAVTFLQSISVDLYLHGDC